MFSKRVTLIATLVLLIPSLAWAMRSKKPQTFTNLQDTNQLTELNTTLADLWNITNGRYTLENITTNPQDTRKGVKGDLVYATFGGDNNLCINTSFPAGMDWTCVNVGTLSTCPGGADGQIQFNDNGDCGGDIPFLYLKNNDVVGIGDGSFESSQRRTDLIITKQNVNPEDGNDVMNQNLITLTKARGEGYYASNPAAAVAMYSSLGTVSAPTVSTDGNLLGDVRAFGYDGDEFIEAAGLRFGTALSGNNPAAIADNVMPGEIEFVVNTGSNIGNYVMILTASRGNAPRFGFGTLTPEAAFDISPFSLTGTNSVSAEESALLLDARTIQLTSGSTIANMRHAQFLAPTLNGVAGGATETVTNAATVFIDQAPSGSNIAIATTAELMFGESTDNTAMIKVQNETSSNTSGRGLNISGANGLGSGQGGTVQIDAGRGGATGIGGSVNLIAGNGGTTSGAGGTVALSSGSGGTGGLGSAGSIILETGDGTGVSNRDGGDIFLQTGNGVSGGSNGTVFILYDSPTTALAEESVLLWVNNSESVGLANGTTLANNRFTIFDSQTINGIAGGDTETITNAATLYIEDAPSGSNITFTNGPYALWVDDGQTRLDGTTTVSGIVVQDTLTATATGALGWSVQTGANTACNTTCTNACVFGQDTDTANGPIVDCTDASADRCTCAGVN